MTDELPADDGLVVETPQDTPEEHPTEGSELAPDTGEIPEEKITFSDDQQKIFDDAINKKTFKLREAERKAEEREDALRKQLEDVQSQIPKDVKPNIPGMPDAFDDDYEGKVALRDEAIRNAAAFDTNQEVLDTQRKNSEYNAQVDAQNNLNKLRDTFVTNSIDAGITVEELQTAGNIVTTYGLDPYIVQEIMKDKDDGGAVLLHLSQSPQSIDALNGASLRTFGGIYADIREKSSVLKPKASNAPPPPTDVKSSGPTSETDPLLEGITITTS